MNKWITIGIAIIVSSIIAANSILLFTEKSQVVRTYYVSEYDRVNENTYTKELEKESVVVPENVSTVTLDVEAVSEFTVTVGDMVQEGEELAMLKTEAADAQRSLWESEEEAYMEEQSQLESIIDDLESEKSSVSSGVNGSGSTSGDTSEDTVINVGVQVDVEISQEGDYANAIAEAEQKLAEIERKRQIISAQLSLDSEDLASLSPISGVVASIEESDGKYFIYLYTAEKSVVTFLEEAEWHEIQEGQKVMNYSTHQEEVVEGFVSTKTEVPANKSEWLKVFKQFDKNIEEPVYEVRIQLNGEVNVLPYGANINSNITTNEVEGAARVKEQWIVNRVDEAAEVYILTEDGKIGRTPVVVPLDLEQYAILSEGLIEGNVVLNADEKYIGAPAFLPFPLDLPTWSSVKAVGWRDYVKLLTYK